MFVIKIYKHAIITNNGLIIVDGDIFVFNAFLNIKLVQSRIGHIIIYKYKNDESETILIVQGMDGIYNIAVEE